MSISGSPPRRTLRRVTKAHPCPVCEHPDWCSYFADEGGCVCMRVKSDRPTKNGGWLHLDDRPHARRPGPIKSAAMLAMEKRACGETATPKRDPSVLQRQHLLHVGGITTAVLHAAAADLGVSAAALQRTRIGWSGRAWSWPMFDDAGRVVGLRYRHPSSGDRWSERGGSEGVFAPHDQPAVPPPAILIVEGPTDLAALLDLIGESPALARCTALGRPSCTGGVAILRQVVRRLQPQKVAVLADSDRPGRRGADTLARCWRRTACRCGWQCRRTA